MNPTEARTKLATEMIATKLREDGYLAGRVELGEDVGDGTRGYRFEVEVDGERYLVAVDSCWLERRECEHRWRRWDEFPGVDVCRDCGAQRPREIDVHRMTDDELRAGVNEFTRDDPPPYDGPSRLSGHDRDDIDGIMKGRGDWFSAQLLRLIAKSDRRNRAALATVYPDHVEAYEKWLRDGVKS